MPEVTLSLPAALGLLVLFLAVGAIVVYAGLAATQRVVNPTVVPTATDTGLPSATPTDTQLPTLVPSATEPPPHNWTVSANDTCGGIAVANGVSVLSIQLANPGINSNCTNLRVGDIIKVPYPTATPPPAPTDTPQAADATRAACQQVNYTVQANDTLSSIAANYGVSMQSIKDWNGLATDGVYIGQPLVIPLCARAATPGPTPTPTIPPPYPAPNLLLPADGAAFTLAQDVVTLQWASIGTLRDNERYQVIVEDITAGQAQRIVEYVTDTKYIVPTSFRPKDNVAHVMRWWVTPVRQTGTDAQGNPIWDNAGAASDKRDFTWVGIAVQATATP